jgi:hypothetical protein
MADISGWRGKGVEEFLSLFSLKCSTPGDFIFLEIKGVGYANPSSSEGDMTDIRDVDLHQISFFFLENVEAIKQNSKVKLVVSFGE